MNVYKVLVVMNKCIYAKEAWSTGCQMRSMDEFCHSIYGNIRIFCVVIDFDTLHLRFILQMKSWISKPIKGIWQARSRRPRQRTTYNYTPNAPRVISICTYTHAAHTLLNTLHTMTTGMRLPIRIHKQIRIVSVVTVCVHQSACFALLLLTFLFHFLFG